MPLNNERSKALPHESAQLHVTGRAAYIDDLPLPADTLHIAAGLSTCAYGKIISADYKAVLAEEGVVAVLTADDFAGHNDISPTGLHDEPILAQHEVQFYGQPIFAVVARDRTIARRAAQLAQISYEPAPHVTEVNGQEADDFVTKPLTLKIGDSEKAIQNAKKLIEGAIRIGGQDHFYLEGHIAVATPEDDGGMKVYTSSQHPSEVQHMVAHVLDMPMHMVTTEVRRMGGGFGGKETQSNLFAVIAAKAAQMFGKTVKFRPDRDDDMVMTGKRHDFFANYKVAYEADGTLSAVDATLTARCGFSADLSGPVTDRALFHVDNCYALPNAWLKSRPQRTNTVSNTAFRGFGGPQGMLVGERMIEEIAYDLGLDPLDIRKRNFYTETKNTTPYHQEVSDNIIARIVHELEESADYQARRTAILEHNKKDRFIKKGIALTPVKFGISFTATWYNQAGALLLLYQDGSFQLNHGGTEMGQGLYTKVLSIVSEEFGLPTSKIRLTATNTGKVPNTSATAASSGSDLNGMAVLDAALKIKERLQEFAHEFLGVAAGDVIFEHGIVKLGGKSCTFTALVKAAYMARIQLSATGFYQTPKIHWDREAGRGHPFYYFAYGASVSEVSVDILTGENTIERVDILHDVGNSLNPAIDLGQIEGGFVQGMGWLTTEELWWDNKGQLKTHAPSTYKIPLASDRPKIFNVALADWSRNKERTIKRSKAVGEPPFMLAMSVFEALSMAVASVADYKICPKLDAPATPERLLMAVERLKKQRHG